MAVVSKDHNINNNKQRRREEKETDTTFVSVSDEKIHGKHCLPCERLD
jgi:hypothetical protein